MGFHSLVVLKGDGVQQQVDAACSGLHGLLVTADDDAVRTQLLSERFLTSTSGDRRDGAAKRLGDFYADAAKATQTCDCNEERIGMCEYCAARDLMEAPTLVSFR